MKNSGLILLLITTAVNGYSQSFKTTEDSLRNYFSEKIVGLDSIEGLWDVVSTKEYYKFDTLYDVVKQSKAERVAIIKKDSKFQSYKLSGEKFNVEFTPTDVKSVYIYRNFYTNNQSSEPHAIINKSGIMEYTYDLPEDETRISLGNRYSEGVRQVIILKWTKVF